MSVLIRCVVVTLLASALLGCGEEPETPEPGSAASPESGSVESPGDDEIQGTVERESDVETLEGGPVAGGVVAIVPTAQAPRLWQGAGFEDGPPPEPEHVSFSLPRAEAEELGATISPLDGEGAFRAEVDEGEYLVCPGEDDQATLHLLGCAETRLAPGMRLRVSSGEAGVRAQPE